MERLTEWVGIGPNRKAIARQDFPDIGDKDCVARLAAYEDTGMAPEEISGLKTALEELRQEVDGILADQNIVQRLRDRGIDVDAGLRHIDELLQAERDGRLVVRPGAPTPGAVCDGDLTGDPGEPGLIGPPRRRDGERRRPEMAEYIERTGLIADMDQAILDIPSSETVDSLTIYAVLRDCACEAPAADVEPVRHGRWSSDRFGNLWCSSCKHCGSSDGIETIYCPNCGTKMDGEA